MAHSNAIKVPELLDHQDMTGDDLRMFLAEEVELVEPEWFALTQRQCQVLRSAEDGFDARGRPNDDEIKQTIEVLNRLRVGAAASQTLVFLAYTNDERLLEFSRDNLQSLKEAADRVVQPSTLPFVVTLIAEIAVIADEWASRFEPGYVAANNLVPA